MDIVSSFIEKNPIPSVIGVGLCIFLLKYIVEARERKNAQSTSGTPILRDEPINIRISRDN